MADDDTQVTGSSNGNSSESQQPQPSPSPPVEQPAAAPADTSSLPLTLIGPGVEREDLLAKARVFLRSPQMQYQDIAAKRQFLAAKGMSELDVEALLREQPYTPMVPPRTYPQPPPSNLPTLLLGLLRLFTWVGVGSLGMLFIYWRWLYPRILATVEARRSLRKHHLATMQKLTISLAALKESHSESLAELPRQNPYFEPEDFAQTRSLTQVLKKLGDTDPDYTSVPPVTLLRCSIADFTKGKTGEDSQPTTEDIFLLLEGKIPWLASEKANHFKGVIYDTLVTCPHFEELEVAGIVDGEAQHPSQRKWKYNAPPPAELSPIVKSLSNLNSSLPRTNKDEPRSNVFQHTLQALSDFTGYISSNVYMPYRPTNGMGMSTAYGLSPAEEALKKEIRALKGLVLNRKTFMPSIPRPPSYQGQASFKPAP
ncbi:hypothetical protein BKA70DRAFT_563466 [Coprinopsis sp. MPI-PUGE-AT-0042]|nr:hypothetical protein BKA70DRAFT_563466 [Coprinopsis sp. MPI-PUGE-AT-0042]